MDSCGGVEQNKDFRLGKENSTMLKILFYYIKGKTSFFPMEIILLILQELEEFKILVKLAKRKRYEKNRSS
jgi:folate-dependent tRNA-U54 methylase TrmFO/GidA